MSHDAASDAAYVATYAALGLNVYAIHPSAGAHRTPAEAAEGDAMRPVNFSTLKHIGKSPAHYQLALTAKREDTDAMRFGRCLHLAVLEPERYRAEVTTWEGTRRGRTWDEWRIANPGDYLTPDERTDVDGMANSVRGSASIRPYLAGRAEVSLDWEFDVVECRGRVDLISDAGPVLDLKSAADASPEAFGRVAWSFDYVAQMAWYSDGLRTLEGTQRRAALLAVEKSAPYACALYVLDDAQMEIGRQVYRRWLKTLTECRASGKWAGYEGVQYLRLPRWAATQAMEAENG